MVQRSTMAPTLITQLVCKKRDVPRGSSNVVCAVGETSKVGGSSRSESTNGVTCDIVSIFFFLFSVFAGE
jgi:hypothetical protein